MRDGSKVVCVDDRFPPDIFVYYDELPTKDAVYVVRGIGVGVSTAGEAGEIVVYLAGVKNPASSTPPFPERGFAQWRFREIEPPKADVEEERHPVEELA